MTKRYIYDCLKDYARSAKLRLHMPGHKGRGGGLLKSIYRFDVTELDVTDNLACPNGAIMLAENDLQKLTGAKKSYILTGGSTLGIFAMLYAVKGMGKKIIVQKNSHKSVFNALNLFGIEPIFLNQRISDGLVGPVLDNLPELCDNDVIGALLTSPDYFGRVLDLRYAAKVLREKNKVLLVDGAHGAHLKFTQPELYCGFFANAWVDGAHKTLKTLTQGALLNANDLSLSDGLREGLNVFASSSPSFLIAGSVEDGVKSFSELNPQVFLRFKRARNYVEANLKKDYRIIDSCDKLKLCLDLRGRADAAELGAFLEKRGIFPELAEGRFVIFILSPEFSALSARKLTGALNSFDRFKSSEPIKDEQSDICPVRAMPYFNAANAEYEYVDLSSAKGRIAAGNAGLFPPCFPLITCGEVYDNRVIAELLSKSTFGIENGKVKVVKQNR